MYKKTSLPRLLSGTVVVAAVAGSTFVASNGVAGADPPAGTLGGNTVAPDPGTNVDAIRSTTGGGCPAGSTTADLKVVGPIGVDPSAQVFPASDPFTFVTITDTQFSNDGAFVQQWQVTFQDAVDARRGVGTPIPTGEYDFTTRCLNRLGNQSLGTYVGGLSFDTPTTYHGLPSATSTSTPSPPPPTSSPTSSPPPSTSSPPPTNPPTSPPPTSLPTPVPGPGAKATTTTLNVIRVSLPFRLGGFVIPFANVRPRTPGTIQFKDGTTNLGSPVPIAAGIAFGGFFVIPPGSHSLTAEFTPANPEVALSSTSNALNFTF